MMTRRTRFSISLTLGLMLALGLALQSFAVGQQSPAGIDYTVDLVDAKNHYLHITAEIPVRGETTELMMAVWTPGSYLVREYARHIDTLEMTAGGKKLDFEKTRKNRWLVQTDGVKTFKVSYRLYCNEMTVRTNFAGKQFAMINGAPTFVTVIGRSEEPHRVKLKMPKNWNRSATSLKSIGNEPHSFVANDFDELVDSPIVAGNVQVYPFTAGGIEHQLVNIGESGYWDGTKAATDLKRVVEAHQEMWGVIPYDRYLFLNMIAETGGGLEHDNSTLIMTSRWSFRNKSSYNSWLSLASHEFFHTWKARRLRPKTLVKYDYENEVYTDGLWIAEGITSYYEDLALVRAGLISRSEYLSRLSSNVTSVQRTEGRKVQSLKDSSYDTWIKFYRPDENSSNTRISYYSKGAVVAFLLDAKIRKLTKGKKSLDDVMQKMFGEYSKSGFTSEEFRKTASEVAGEDLSDWFVSAIDSTDELDYSDIEAIGVQVPNNGRAVKAAATKAAATKAAATKAAAAKAAVTKAAAPKKADKQEAKPKADASPEKTMTKKEKREAKRKAKMAAKAEAGKTSSETESKKDAEKKDAQKKAKSEAAKAKSAAKKPPAKKQTLASAISAAAKAFAGSARPAPKPRPWLGMSTKTDDGNVVISSVTPGSPAADVGLNIDDEVIAVNGFRISRSVDSRLAQYEVGDEIEVLISRRGEVMTVRVEIGSRASESWSLRYISKPSSAQRKQMELWLKPKS